MKVYRVWAQSISDVYIDIGVNDDEDENKALELAKEVDGGDFHDDGYGDWVFGSVMEMENTDPDYIQEELEN